MRNSADPNKDLIFNSIEKSRGGPNIVPPRSHSSASDSIGGIAAQEKEIKAPNEPNTKMAKHLK